MASGSQITCNFTIVSDLYLGISFESSGSGNYGGTVTIATGVGGPVSTSLWDSDGNVFFTLFDSEVPGLTCIINSGANPATFAPFVEVGTQVGLNCILSGPVQAGDFTYDYMLTVDRSAAAPATETASGAAPGTASADYKFSVGLFYATDEAPADLQLWGTGTMTLDTSAAPAVSGVLIIPNPLFDPLPFKGLILPSFEGQESSAVFVSGQTAAARINATFSYDMDGFLFSGSYVAGLVDILSGEEWIRYVIQGLAPQARRAGAGGSAPGRSRPRPRPRPRPGSGESDAGDRQDSEPGS